MMCFPVSTELFPVALAPQATNTGPLNTRRGHQYSCSSWRTENQPIQSCLLKLQHCLKNWEQKLIEKLGTNLSEWASTHRFVLFDICNHTKK